MADPRALDGESVALSWKRAEELINAVRRGHGEEPLGLDNRPLDTGGHDPAHLDSPEDSPTPRR